MDTPMCLQSQHRYTTCGWYLTFNITAPFSASGAVGYSPFFASAPLIAPEGQTMLNFRILMPRSLEGDKGYAGNLGNKYGCYPVDGTPAQAFGLPYADDGTPYSGNALLVAQGGCNAATKQEVAAYFNVSLLIVTQTIYAGSDTGEFTNEPFWGWTGSVEISDHAYVPTFSLSTDDSLPLLNLVSQHNFSVPVSMSVFPSGRMSSYDRELLVNVTQYLTIGDDQLFYEPGMPTSARDWTDMANPDLDPCYDGIGAIWCENGKPVSILMHLMYSYVGGWIDDTAFSQMTGVRAWSFPSGIPFPFPVQWCSVGVAESMQMSWIQNFGSFTSLPDCWDRLPNLFGFLLVGNGVLETVPDSLYQSATIALLNVIGLTGPGSFPVSLSAVPKLTSLILQDSGLAGNFPSIDGLVHLRQIVLDDNDLSQSLTAASFLDNLPLLTQVSIQNCGMWSYLPNLVNSQALLIDLALNGNAFMGAIPSSWSTFIPAVVNLQLHHNQLGQNPLDPQNHFSILQGVTQLVALDLSHNQINFNNPDDTIHYNVWIFLEALVTQGGSVISLDLSYNNFTGYSSSGNIGLIGSVTKIDLSHNHLQCLPGATFVPSTIQVLDVSYNDIEGSCESNDVVPGLPADFTQPGSQWQILNLQGNPNLRSDQLSSNYGLPSYLVPNFDILQQRVGDRYLCGTAVGDPSVYQNFQILLDPEFNAYQMCFCEPGTYGSAPQCPYLPDQVIVPPSSSQPLVDALQAVSVFNSTALQDSFVSDNAYGSQRLMTGMTSVFVVQSNDSSVLVTNLLICINLDLFTHSTDILEVFQGSESEGVLAFSISGTSVMQQKSLDLVNFIAGYSNASTFVVQVVRPVAMVRYSSRQTEGSLFSMDHSFSTNCPSGYYVSNLTGYCQALLPCEITDYLYVTGGCSLSSTTMNVQYVLRPGSNCIETNPPAAQTVSCDAIPATSSVLGILIALGCMVGLLAFAPFIAEIYNAYCIKCCGGSSSANDDTKNKKPYYMEVFQGTWTVFLTVSWILQIVSAAGNFGDVQTWKCNLRIYTIVLGMISSQGSLFVSGQVISNILSLQLLNLRAFSIRSSVILFASLFVATAVLIVMTTTSGNMISLVQDSTLLNQNVCSLGSALFYFAPLACITVALTVVNLFSLLPSFLNLTRQIRAPLNRIESQMVKLEKQHRWGELLILSLLSILNFASYLSVTVTTYFGGNLKNNAEITRIQFAVYLSNVLVSIFLRYVLPLVFQTRTQQKNSTTAAAMITNLSQILVSQADHPMIQVLDNSYYRWTLGKYIQEHDEESFNAFSTTDDLLNILSQVQYLDLNEILIVTNIQNNGNDDDNESKNNLQPSPWFSELSAMFQKRDLNKTLPFPTQYLDSLVDLITKSISPDQGSIRRKILIKALYPIAKVLFEQLEPLWDSFSTSKDFVKPNAVSKWSNFFLNLNDDEKQHTLLLLQQYTT